MAPSSQRGGQAWGFPPLEPEALSQWKPATTATETLATVVPAQNWLRCGYDSGGAWEALSSAGGKWRGGSFGLRSGQAPAPPAHTGCASGGHLGMNRQHP